MDLAQIKAQAEAAAYQMVIERCKVDLYYLCKYILGGEEVLDAKVHGPLCRSMRPLLFYQHPEDVLQYEFPSDYGREEEEGMPTEEQKQEFWEWQHQFEPNPDTGAIEDKFDHRLNQILALMPRGTLKSTVITIGFAIQWHLNFPEDRVLLDSETFTKSKAFLTEIKGHYQGNQKLRKLFYAIHGIMPDEKKSREQPDGTETWSTEMIVLTCRSKARKEPSIDCAGIDVTKNGMHYDLILMDDLHSEKNSKTADQRQVVKDHYKLAFSLLDPGKSVAVIGTRWDDDDLYSAIIEEEQDEFNFITRSAESEEGVLFYPKKLDAGFLMKQRKKQGGYIYSCQYLNNPVDDETADFKRENFSYRTLKDIENTAINWYGLVDPSYTRPGTTGKKSDYAAIVIGGMDGLGEIYARLVKRWKASYADIIDSMFELDDQFFAMGITLTWQLEVIGTKTLEHDLEQAQMKRQLEGKRRIRVILVRQHPNSKEDRIKALSPYYERHTAHHIIGAPGIGTLERELMRYPKAKNDDASDAWSGILRIGRKPRRENPDPKARQKHKDRITMLNKPRSPMVGY